MADLLDGIESALRGVVTDLPYCSISVKLLCERAGVTRKAFYKRFRGKHDVIRTIFARDVVNPELELMKNLSLAKMRQNVPQMERRMFQSVRGDGDFYGALVSAPRGGRYAFLNAARSVFRDFNEAIMREYGFGGEPWQFDYVATYFADAKSAYLLHWIESGFPIEVEKASEFYARMAQPFWRLLA